MRIRKTAIKFLLAAAVCFGLAAPAKAIIAYNYPTGLNGNQAGDFSLSLGMLFTVNTPVYVTQLGAFDNPGNNYGTFGGPVSVAIYAVQLSGNNITSGSLAVNPVTFTTGDSGSLLSGTSTTLKDIGDVQLGTGTYMVVANYYGAASGNELNYNRYYNPSGTNQPSANTGGGLLSYGGNYYSLGSTTWGSSLPGSWTFHIVGDPGDTWRPRYMAGNFDFAPVPEVAGFAMIGVGLLGFVYVGRCYWLRRRMVVA